jgi:hypothetical protein
MASRRSREAALADLVAGLLDARVDPATDRFDAELAAAEDDGRIDAQTAKVLRWWQREAQRALVEHARVVLPPTLLALEQAASGAGREVEASAASWARAAAEDRPVAERTAEPRTPAPAPDETSAAGETGATDADAGDTADVDDTPDEPLTPPADLSEHRRRLLVAGLTRVRTTT